VFRSRAAAFAREHSKLQEIFMKHVTSSCCAMAMAFSFVAMVGAQQGPGPRKVIQILREEIKAARSTAHGRAEEAYVRAFRAAKAPVYYVGLRSMTGPLEAWFLSSYDSYAALEQENDLVAKNASLSRALEMADEQDAGFRTGGRTLIAELVEDLSYRMRPTVQDMRYMNVSTIRVRPGWGTAFEDARKIGKAAHEKANVDEHWAIYRVVSGMPAGTFLMLQGSMSLKEEDTDHHTEAYRDALGDEGRNKLQQFQRDGILGVDTSLFEISPQMSNVPDEWLKARPDFWKLPAMKTSSTAKPAESAAKPSANQ
jgi:hypothetical protein